MLDFQLFRLKVHRFKSLFQADEPPALLIRAAIESRTEKRTWRGYVWHIGNVAAIDDSGLYFAFGRTTRSNVSVFNPAEGAFVEQEFETAPYTHVIVDVDIGL